MMGYGNFGIGWSGFSLVGSLLWIVILIDAVLLGIWLWQQIQRR